MTRLWSFAAGLATTTALAGLPLGVPGSAATSTILGQTTTPGLARVIVEDDGGTGIQWNNHYSATYLGPDGTAYVATLAGLARIQDRP